MNPDDEGRPGARCDAEGHCITCSDEALPMRVVAVDAALGTALCDSNCIQRRVNDLHAPAGGARL